MNIPCPSYVISYSWIEAAIRPPPQLNFSIGSYKLYPPLALVPFHTKISTLTS